MACTSTTLASRTMLVHINCIESCLSNMLDQAVAALDALASACALSLANEYRKVPKMAMPDPTQFRSATGFLKNSTLDTTTATRFMVFPTLKVTGEMPWFSTMYENCNHRNQL